MMLEKNSILKVCILNSFGSVSAGISCQEKDTVPTGLFQNWYLLHYLVVL